MMNCPSEKGGGIVFEMLALLVFTLELLVHFWPVIVGVLGALLVLGLIVGRDTK